MPLETIHNQKTVLLLSGDGDLLAVANAALSAKNRVLNAWSTESALWVLERFPVDSVLIHDQMKNCEKVERTCAARGIGLRVMTSTVESGILRLKLPELAERISAVSSART